MLAEQRLQYNTGPTVQHIRQC